MAKTPGSNRTLTARPWENLLIELRHAHTHTAVPACAHTPLICNMYIGMQLTDTTVQSQSRLDRHTSCMHTMMLF